MKVPFWKNPYVAGFALGAVVLTVLPLLQRPFLKAPPPLKTMTAWSLTGSGLSLEGLQGRVVLLTAVTHGCDVSCAELQSLFGTAINHVDDLGEVVWVVTLVGSEAQEGLHKAMSSASARWKIVPGSESDLREVVGQLQDGLDEFLGRAGPEFGTGQVIALIDQNGAIRGYWKADAEGRGNSINAARLLAKHGPTP